MPPKDLCEYCNQRPKSGEGNGRVHAYCGRNCANKAQNAPRAANPPPPADLCENCGERPKYKDLSGKVYPHCGKRCANTQREPTSNRNKNTYSGSGRSQRPPRPSLTGLVASEIEVAKKTLVNSGDNTVLLDFPRKSGWKIEDNRGNSEVILRREYQNEQIVISVSLNDNDPLDDDFADLSDDLSDGDDRGGNGSDGDGSLTRGSGEESTSGPVGPVPCIITITKHSKGALLVRALAADGKFMVDNLTHTTDVNTATGTSVEADFAREKMYIAPQFDDLIQDLQNEFMSYLRARGIDDELARFLVQYVKRKETLERVNWLEGLHSFFT